MTKESLITINKQDNYLPAERDRTTLADYRETDTKDDDDEIDLRELWLVIMRRKGTIALIASLVFLVTLIFTLMMTPIYRASATVQIQPESTNKVVNYDIAAQSAPVNDKDFYQTQYELLKSRNLAKRVIDRLGLEAQLRDPSLNLKDSYLSETFSQLLSFFSPKKPQPEGENNSINNTTSLDNADLAEQLGQQPLEDKFLDNLSIAPVKNSQIVTVNYDSPNPEQAAFIANSVVENFINMNLERRANAARYAEDFLQEELVKAKGTLQENERKQVDFEQKQGIINTSGEKGDSNLITQSLISLNAGLVNAEIELSKIQSIADKTADADSAKQVLTNSTIQELKKALAQAETQYQTELAVSSAYDTPVVRALRQDLNKLQSEFQAERVASSAGDSVVVRGLKQDLARLQSQYQAELKAPQARDNTIVRSMLQQLAQLRSQYQAELKAPQARDNSTVRTMLQQLAQLRSQYEAELKSSTAYQDPTIRTLTNSLNDLSAQYQEQLKIYKPAYPSMVQLQQRIDEVRKQISAETRSIQSSKTNNLKQQIDELQAQVSNEARVDNSNKINNLKQQIDELQTQVNNEASINSSSKINNLKQQIDEITGQIQRETKITDTTKLTNLQQRISDVRAQLERETNVTTNSTLASLKQRIGELKAQIAAEATTIASVMGNSTAADLEAAQQREKELRSKVDEQKKTLSDLNNKSVGYNTIKREVETSRNLYEGLLQRIKEIGVASGVGSNNISVVDQAVIPFSKYKPNTKLNLALGAVLGLFLGTVVAFLLEFLDDRIKTTVDLERILHLPLLGITPRIQKLDAKEAALLTAEQPTSATAEAFRSLRTNLLFATSSGAPHSLAITSSMPSEAKSSTCTNLAAAFAQAGKRILIVDADLRKPTLHKRLGLDNTVGLTNYLTHQSDTQHAIQQTPINNVHAITAGPTSPNPAELLSSERLLELCQLAPEHYDMIIFDSPPVMGLADALIIANRVQATILVAAHAQSKKRPLADAYQRLRHAQANLIGVIMTKMRTGASYGYSYDYYYQYSRPDQSTKQLGTGS